MNHDDKKTGNPGISHIKDDRNNSGSSIGSAVVMIAIVALSLVLLKVETNRNMKPVNIVFEPSKDNNGVSRLPESASSDATATTTTESATASSIKKEIDSKPGDIIRARMKQILTATKKVPFKARMSTETGFKGFWTQNGLSYRFEDPLGTQAIIFSAEKKRLWVLDISENIAFETKFNEESVDAYGEFSPAMFLEVLSDSTDTATKNLEDILPSDDRAKLTFNTIGLPKRWEGYKSDGTSTFIAWDYTQLVDVPVSDFELPEGVIVKNLTPNDIESGR